MDRYSNGDSDISTISYKEYLTKQMPHTKCTRQCAPAYFKEIHSFYLEGGRHSFRYDPVSFMAKIWSFIENIGDFKSVFLLYIQQAMVHTYVFVG